MLTLELNPMQPIFCDKEVTVARSVRTGIEAMNTRWYPRIY